MPHFIILLSDQQLESLYGLIGVVVIGLLFFGFNTAGKGLIYVVGKFWRERNSVELTPVVIIRYDSYLRNISYYQKLDQENKRKFIIRLAEFMNTKEFRGVDGLEVTEEMKVMISASATQLLFGLDAYWLNFFNFIRVFPEVFYSQLMRVHMKGGTTKGGVIMFSWKDFKEGYKNDSDKLNLGLHEFAHALKIEATHGGDFDQNFVDGFERWDQATAETMEQVKQGAIPFMRKYGGTNAHEFWAVCIEHFFETPKEFKEQLPKIYGYLTVLLNQDPLLLNSRAAETTIEDAQAFVGYNAKIVLPPARNATSSVFGNEVLTGACIVLFFPVFAATVGLTEYALITNSSIWMTVLAFSLVGLVIFFRSWKNGEKELRHYLIHSIVLCGMVGTLLLHMINSGTAVVGKPEVYKIIDTKTIRGAGGSLQNYAGYRLILEGYAYKDEDVIVNVGRVPEHDLIVLKISEGIFGIKYRASRTFMYSTEPDPQ